MSVLMIIMQVEEKRNKIAGTFQYGSNGEVLSGGRFEGSRIPGAICSIGGISFEQEIIIRLY